MRTPIAAPRVDPNVKPQPQAPTAGVASMNRGLRSLDQGMASLDAQLQERERKNGELWAAKKLAEAKSHWTKTAAERELSADGDAAGYADAMDKDFAAYSEGVLAEAPNRYAKERLEIGLVNVGGKVGASARVFEATRRVATRLDAVTTTINTEVNNVLSGEAFEDSLANTEAAIKAADLPADKEAALLRSTRSNMAESHLRARMRTDPVGVLKDLEDGKYDSYLSPPAKEQLFNAVRTDAGRAIGEAEHDAKKAAGGATPMGGAKVVKGIRKDYDWRPHLVGGGTRKDAISGLDPGFADMVASMLMAAPKHIRDNLKITSAYRDSEIQEMLWNKALKKYGSAAKARKWVAPPGRSHHNKGGAIDFKYGSAEAREWAHANASTFGLHFALGNEPWHIEPSGSRGGKGHSVAVRSDGAFDHIADVRVRAAAQAAFAAREAKDNRERKAFLLEFDDEIAFLSEGNDEPPDSKYTRQNMIDLFGPVDGERLYARKERAIEDGELWKDVRQMPREVLAEKRAELVAATKDPSLLEEDGRHKEATARLATFDDMVAKREAAIAKDPAGYALAAVPGLQVAAKNIEEHPRMYADLMLQGQAGIGIAEPKILTGPMAAAMVKDIATTENALEGQKIQAMKEQWGEHWPQVLKEMRAAGLSGGQFMAAVYADDPALSEEIIGATSVGIADLKKGLPSAETRAVEEEIDGALLPYMQAQAAGRGAGDTIGQFNEVRDVMVAWALMKYRHGDGEAATHAVERFMESKFLEPDTMTGVDALIPREFNDKPISARAIEDATAALQSREALEQFKPTIIGPAGPAAMERTLNAAENSGVWVSNEDNSGLILMVPDETGALVPLINEKGKRRELPYRHIAGENTGGFGSDFIKALTLDADAF